MNTIDKYGAYYRAWAEREHIPADKVVEWEMPMIIESAQDAIDQEIAQEEEAWSCEDDVLCD